MVVTVDGQPRFKWWVSTGARGYATPSGHYKVSWLDEHHKSALVPFGAGRKEQKNTPNVLEVTTMAEETE
jgi:L,D-transpeptidase catalytic domain